MIARLKDRPALVFWILAAYFVIQLSVRLLLPHSLELDEAQQIFYAQWTAVGYDTQPPFYNWVQTAILQRASAPNSGRFAPALGVTDYYWGDKNVDFPLGSIRNGGGVLQDPLFAESPPLLSLVSRLLPDPALEWLADRSITWWAMTAVLPDPDNRVTVKGERIDVAYLANNREAHDRLVYRWLDTIKKTEADPLTTVVQPAPIYPRGEAPLSVMGFACGTCRMGSDPASAVVDLQGRCHELANLWIADASVFPSCPAVGPGLTVIANALRVAGHLRALFS